RALVFSSVQVEGDARHSFQIDTLPAEMEPSQTLALGVTYGASTEGADGATLVILSNADNAPEARFSLVGRTISACPPGKSPCDGACVDLATDIGNCGTCGTLCAQPSHANAKCLQGSCGRGPCWPGYYDIDGTATFGCESTCLE